MSLQYLGSSSYNSTVARLVAVLNTHRPTIDCPDRLPRPNILRYNLSAALWAARIDGGRLLDPAFTDSRRGKALLVALEELEPDEGSGRYERDQIVVALMDAEVFPARVRLKVA